MSDFGDFEDDDAFCEGDPPLDDINWEQVAELQARIDALPTGTRRRPAIEALIVELIGEGD